MKKLITSLKSLCKNLNHIDVVTSKTAENLQTTLNFNEQISVYVDIKHRDEIHDRYVL